MGGDVRAAVLWKVGDPLELRDDVRIKDPGPNEVRVRIAASGICHSDVSIQNGTVDQPLPSVLGHEGAGEVLEVGAGVDRLAPGDHVVLNWNPPCGMCAECLGGQPNLCYQLSMHNPAVTKLSINDESVHSLTGLGTFAEEVVVPHQAVIKIPSDIPLDIAALVGCGVMTGAGAALNTAKVQPGSSVAVIGCGGVGISVLQGARICGAAEIVAVDLNPEKREFAKKFGATHTASPDELPQVSAEVTGGRGFDYAFEAIGLAETMRLTYDTARRGGTAVIVGMAKADAMVSLLRLRARRYGEETARIALRVRRRPARLQPAASPLARRSARPRGDDLQAPHPRGGERRHGRMLPRRSDPQRHRVQLSVRASTM